jgi:hypothetical protein
VVIIRVPANRTLSAGPGLTFEVEQDFLGVFNTYCFTAGTDTITVN